MKNILIHGLGQNNQSWNETDKYLKEKGIDAICPDLFEMTGNLAKEYTVADYKKYIDWLGSEVILKTSSGEKRATAVDVDWDGGLLCIIGGSLKKINSAEVSLRL